MSFQEELNAVSRTPEDVNNMIHEKEYSKGMRDAEIDYEDIKQELLKMANSGKYTAMSNDKHEILLYFQKPGI